MFVVQNYRALQARITSACLRAQRDPAEVTLVGVTKTVGVEDIVVAYEHGLTILGENRVQEAAVKIESLRQKAIAPQWHLIGHLQTNKAKRAIELFDVIQAVDSFRLAETLQRNAEAGERLIEVFVQVNTSGESSKFGAAPQEALQLIREISGYSHLRLTGLMTIGALDPDSSKIRQCFRDLRVLAETVTAHRFPNVTMRHLSMGMTDDFEIAIAEGATMIRVGRALFGERP
jgi:pyridoxal phosphate enzyme (YggS family)